MEFKNLLSPLKIGNMEIKNRVMLLAMGKMMDNIDHTVGEKNIGFVENLAKNNVGLIIPTAMAVTDNYPSKGFMCAALFDDMFIPGLSKLTAAAHKYGSKIAFQLWHPGLSPYGCSPEEVKAPQDWTIEEIRTLQREFADAAVRAKKAGADAVEFHLAHNYLAENFLSPLFNKRTDEYGADTTENALRFSLEAIAMIREACGEDYPILTKINGSDVVPGGVTTERLVEAAVLLEKAGIAMISVSAGGGLSDFTGMSDDGKRPEGWKVPLAEAVKKAVSIPVCATGSIRHAEYAEGILAGGKCDMIGLGRGLVAEPEFVTKIEQGRVCEMRHCISCMTCVGVFAPGVAGCSINPLSQREYENIQLKEDGDGRTVVVVGSGPAGLEAAVTLAQRKFKVIVLEADKEIGGMERIASLPTGKSKIAWHLDYYKRQMNLLGIEVRLNTAATPELLKELAPYAVFVAAGANQIVPLSIPGIKLPHVVSGIDVLDNYKTINGKKIVVIGAGLVGIETAHTCAENGNTVSVIDLLKEHPDATSGAMNYPLAMGYAVGKGVDVKMGYQLLEITGEAVFARNVESGEKITLPADVVILCMGRRPNTDLYEKIKETMPNVKLIGDSNAVGKIRDAVQAGFDAAIAL